MSRNSLLFTLFPKGECPLDHLAYAANRTGEVLVHARGELLDPCLNPADEIVLKSPALHVQLLGHSAARLGKDLAAGEYVGTMTVSSEDV